MTVTTHSAGTEEFKVKNARNQIYKESFSFSFPDVFFKYTNTHTHSTTTSVPFVSSAWTMIAIQGKLECCLRKGKAIRFNYGSVRYTVQEECVSRNFCRFWYSLHLIRTPDSCDSWYILSLSLSLSQDECRKINLMIRRRRRRRIYNRTLRAMRSKKNEGSQMSLWRTRDFKTALVQRCRERDNSDAMPSITWHAINKHHSLATTRQETDNNNIKDYMREEMCFFIVMYYKEKDG